MKTLSKIKTAPQENRYALTPAETSTYENETLGSRQDYTFATLEDDEDTEEDLDIETEGDMDDFDDTNIDDEDLDLELDEDDDDDDDGDLV